jgi:O-antigen ligase
MHDRSGHAHNMLLETALLYGIPIAIVVAALLCLNIKDSICSKIPMLPAITAFIVVLGMVESPMVGMPADPLLALWLAALFARPLEQRAAGKPESERLGIVPCGQQPALA